MSVLPILLWPVPRLSQAAAPVGAITEEIRSLAADMLETMYDAPGRGLAGPQVGAMLRLFVMDTDWTEGTPAPRVFLDPEVLELSDETVEMTEGCLSIPDVTVTVTRPAGLRLAWTDLDGRRQSGALDGIAARCALHELDHLNGLVHFDRLTPEARAEALA